MKSWIAATAVYNDRRMLTILLLGFSSGLPSPLLFFNLTVWLKDEGFSYASIGLFSLVGAAYALNFLWAPLIDNRTLGAFTRYLGRRRSWALLTQIALMASIFCMGFLGPSAGLPFFATSAIMVAFFSATLDIIIDAYRIDVLAPHEYAAGSAMTVFGWHIGGTIVGGAGGLYLAALFDWRTAYMVLAGLVLVGIITILVCREPDTLGTEEYATQADTEADRVNRHPALRHGAGVFLASMYRASRAPLNDFFERLGGTALLILGFILIYKIGEAMLGRMSGVFYRDLGFSHADIADVAKLYGVTALIIGGISGGVLASRLGLLKALLISGILMAATNLSYSWLAVAGNDFPVFVFAVVSDHLTAGMATTTFVAYLSSLCNNAYSATQYALLASAGNFARIIYASASGFIITALGGSWSLFFMATAAASIPGLLLLLWMIRRLPPPEITQSTE